MIKIGAIVASEVLSSRSNPTIEARLQFDNDCAGRAAVPSRASTGNIEVVKLRNGGSSRIMSMPELPGNWT